jgi:predicted ATPase
MKIQVTNLGAIKEGTIDLSKKLNVFCGPNGTGKTYMAYAIYGLTKLENRSLGLSLQDDDVTEFLESNSINFRTSSQILVRFPAN